MRYVLVCNVEPSPTVITRPKEIGPAFVCFPNELETFARESDLRIVWVLHASGHLVDTITDRIAYNIYHVDGIDG